MRKQGLSFRIRTEPIALSLLVQATFGERILLLAKRPVLFALPRVAHFAKKNGMRETGLPITIFSSSLQRQLRKVGSVAAIAEQWSNTLLVAII
jgi:hypothetical protein